MKKTLLLTAIIFTSSAIFYGLGTLSKVNPETAQSILHLRDLDSARTYDNSTLVDRYKANWHECQDQREQDKKRYEWDLLVLKLNNAVSTSKLLIKINKLQHKTEKTN